MRRLFAVLLAVSGLLLFLVAGQVEANAQGADDPAQVEAGKAVFEQSCAGCHGLDGAGSDRGRPLIGIASQGDRARHVASVTNGRGNMPAFGDSLAEEDIDAAISYVRLTFVEAEAATTSEEESSTELALTGVNSTQLAVIGIAMLAGGVQLVAFGRRRDT